MTLKTRFVLLTAAILVGFSLAGGMAVSTVEALRPEGDAMRAVRDDNALLADVAPPALDVGESVSTVARLATATGAEQVHLLRDLQAQRQAFGEAVTRWRSHPRLRSAAMLHVIETGEAFHRAVETEFLPVVRRGDGPARRPNCCRTASGRSTTPSTTPRRRSPRRPSGAPRPTCG